MPQSAITAAARDADLLAQLRRLARKGAYAVAAPEPGETYAVFSPRNACAAPIATLSRGVIARARAAGWLADDGSGDRVRLSRDGETAMRRYLSRPTGDCQKRSDPSMQSTRSRGEPPARPARPVRMEGPLAWLHRRKDAQGRPLISPVQFAAGERLAGDYARARLEARVTANWSLTASCSRAVGTGGGGVEISDGAIAARERLHRALLAVGPQIGALLVDVCCHDQGLETAEKSRRWPSRSAKVVLDIGLTHLARHYGMIAPERREAPGRVRAWSEAGLTSNLDAWL